MVEMTDGARILLRRFGRPNGTRLALSHGNGLAIDAYLPFWWLLIDTYDVILFDARNHGRNPLHSFDGHNWDRVGQDMTEIQSEIVRLFGEKPIVGCFHSLTAVAAIRQVLKFGGTWQKLILFDPPFYPVEGHALRQVHDEHLSRMERLARRRPATYGTPAEFADVLRSRHQFSRWVPGAHQLFAEATLRRCPGHDGWELACPGNYEAHLFKTQRDSSLWARLVQGMHVPLAIIGADSSLPDTDTPARLCQTLASELGIEYELIPDTTHMLQLEEPEACARAFERILNAPNSIKF